MGSVNKTRYAILGMLLECPSTGYEIKRFMGRSTAYFWQESDSTIYPMLKVLAREGKVLSEVDFVGRKKKEVFSITAAGRAEFKSWIKSSTRTEVPRNEFLLKLFFLTNGAEILRLFRERLSQIEVAYEEYRKIEERLEGLPDSSRKKVRLEALKYGISHLRFEVEWLKKGIIEYENY